MITDTLWDMPDFERPTLASIAHAEYQRREALKAAGHFVDPTPTEPEDLRENIDKYLAIRRFLKSQNIDVPVNFSRQELYTFTEEQGFSVQQIIQEYTEAQVVRRFLKSRGVSVPADFSYDQLNEFVTELGFSFQQILEREADDLPDTKPFIKLDPSQFDDQDAPATTR